MTGVQYQGDLAREYSSVHSRMHELNRISHDTWMREVGDVRGLRVLDLACGSGHSSRLLAKAGAFVTGVDLSAEMIALAEKEDPGGRITYYVSDAATLDLGVRFDMVTPTFLFNYAKSEDELRAFIRTTRNHLVSGARLVGLCAWDPIVPRLLNSGHWSEFVNPHERYAEGAKVRLHLLDDEGSPACKPFEYTHWSAATYERLLKESGFNRINWVTLKIPEELRAKYENWKELERANASVVVAAFRA